MMPFGPNPQVSPNLTLKRIKALVLAGLPRRPVTKILCKVHLDLIDGVPFTSLPAASAACRLAPRTVEPVEEPGKASQDGEVRP